MVEESIEKTATGGFSSAVKGAPTVKFLREHLAKSGCVVRDNFIKAVHCDKRISGVYVRGKGECVRRRVMKSVIANPYCSEAAAKDAMEAVWDVCYNDTKPFDRAP
ncbi:hypothetical protein L1049_003149 [Liquidambar formosana]|uniref:Mitochondrial inner membrane protease ATP23 n=1 Tax=Liquidambar formosana TaxID=63359 RepID=A0AAP0R7A7_LIQFO